jgi:ubiquinone/menaquinone biosynthesis C-methylase UbiE
MGTPLGDVLTGWLRYRRIARAFDAACSIAEHVPRDARVLDVGCGNGFIAHHLGALGRTVVGVDLARATEAPISYVTFDGRALPFADLSFDAVVFSFVLHHSQNIAGLLGEARRVLRPGGRIVVYEDIPECWHDRALCLWHEQKWLPRTGPCTFLRVECWVDLFEAVGLHVAQRCTLPRLRNPIHPVQGARFVLERRPDGPNGASAPARA